MDVFPDLLADADADADAFFFVGIMDWIDIGLCSRIVFYFSFQFYIYLSRYISLSRYIYLSRDMSHYQELYENRRKKVDEFTGSTIISPAEFFKGLEISGFYVVSSIDSKAKSSSIHLRSICLCHSQTLLYPEILKVLVLVLKKVRMLIKIKSMLR